MIERLQSFQAARRLSLPVLAGVAGLLPLPAFAADEAAGAGNIAWVLSASALVLFMTLPGLALFYGGLVRWGQGWLAGQGTIDFAGGIVVHTTAGVSALVIALLIGSRRGFPDNLIPPHSPGLTMAGAGMLWVGWFGFNGGSALAANNTAAMAILATHLAACTAALTWMAIEWWRLGKPTSVGLVTGCVAGLATITPASGYVGPLGAIVIGAAGGAVCLFATSLVKQRLRIDDTLDVFAVHGIGGMLGTMLAAVFIASQLGGVGYAAGMDMPQQLGAQLLGIVAAAAWSALATFGLAKVLGLIAPARVTPDYEEEGLDIAVHGERAYEHG